MFFPQWQVRESNPQGSMTQTAHEAVPTSLPFFTCSLDDLPNCQEIPGHNKDTDYQNQQNNMLRGPRKSLLCKKHLVVSYRVA